MFKKFKKKKKLSKDENFSLAFWGEPLKVTKSRRFRKKYIDNYKRF